MGIETYLRVGIDGTAAEQGARLVNRSLDEISKNAEKTTTQVDKIKSAFTQLGYSSQGLKNAILGFAGGIELVRLLDKAISGLVNSFKYAFNSVEDFKINVASMSAVVMTFMDKSKGMNMAEMWKQAREYASNLVPTLEIISSKMLLTGQHTTLMFTELAKGGFFLDTMNKQAVAGFQAIGNAIAILTKGQDPERQIMTEIRAVVTGQAQAGSMLMRMLEAIDPQLKSHLKIWREEGTAIEHIGHLLEGFDAATAELATTWQAVSTTTMTYITQILRGGMQGAYDSILGSMSKFRDMLLEHKQELMSGVHKAWLAIQGSIEVIGNLLDPFTPTLKFIGSLVGTIAQGFGIIAYVLLPPITEILGNVVKSILQVTNVFGDLLSAAARAMTGDFAGAVAELKQSWADVKQSGRFLGDAFSTGFGDQVTQRMSEFDKKFNTSLKYVKPPKPAPLDDVEDKSNATRLKLSEVQMKNELDLIKKQGQLQNQYYAYQFEQGSISLQNYYDNRMAIITKASESELKTIEYQISQAEDARERVKKGTDKSEKEQMEFTIKIVELQGRAQGVRLDTAQKIQSINQQSIRDLRTMYDLIHQNDDLVNHLASLEVANDPYKSQMEAIRQRYDSEKQWITELAEFKTKNNLNADKENERLALLEKNREKEIQNFKKEEWRRGAQAFADSLDSLANTLMQGNKHQFEQGKKMAIASALISTYLGATQAFTSLSSIPYVGPALGIAAAAAAIAAGFSRIDQIESTEFSPRAMGGSVEAGGNYLVGENGPELIQMGSAGSVVPNHALALVQQAQLDATLEQTKAIKNNSLAVQMLASNFHAITGMLTNVKMPNYLGMGMEAYGGNPTWLRQVINRISDTWAFGFKMVGNFWSGQWSNMFADWKNFNMGYKQFLFGGGPSVISAAGIRLGYKNGGVYGDQWVNEHTEGGLFGSDQDKLQRKSLSVKELEPIQTQADRVKKAVLSAASVFGIGAEQFEEIELKLKAISLMGLSKEKAQAAMEEWFHKLGDAFASGVEDLPDFTQKGERAFDALMRLAMAIQTVNGVTELLGGTLLDATLQNADYASQLIDLMGGMDEFRSKTSQFFTSFYTEEEQARAKMEQGARIATNVFNDLGITMPTTVDELKAIVNGLDLTSESGRNAYASIMDITGSLNDMFEGMKVLAEGVKKLINTFADSQLTILNTIRDIRTGMSMLSPEEAYRQAQKAFATSDISHLPENAKALLQASKAYNASGAGYQSDLQMVLARLGMAAGISDTSLDNVNKQIYVLETIQTLIEQGNTSQLQVMLETLDKNTIIAHLLSQYLHALDPSIPSYAVGTPFVENNQTANIHHGEAVIDAQSNAVLQKYGIRVSASRNEDKETERTSLLREQNRLLKIQIQVLQTGFKETISSEEKQTESLEVIARKSRFAGAA